MPLTKIALKPGIDRSTTNYGAVGGYYSCDKVRFRDGTPEKIGGWVKYHPSQLAGTPRALFAWVSLSGTQLLAVGTSAKYYIESGGGFADVTPLRSEDVALGSNPFATTSGSSVVRVTQAAHGAGQGDYVILSGASGFAGLLAGDLNREFAISLVDGDHYDITVPGTASSTTSGGGASVLASFQLVSSNDVAIPGLGWNAGTWNSGNGWNTPFTEQSATYSSLRLWTQESFGEDHVFAPRNGPLYFWDYSNGLSTRAIRLDALEGAHETPLFALKLLMSTADRHLIVFGTNPIGSTTLDPLFIRWADTESLTEWVPSVENAAGGIRLSSGNHIVTAARLKQETLVFTDSSLFSMQFIGAPDIFGVQPVADNISIVAPGAATVAGNTAYWMGNDKFYLYNGRVQTLPCPLNNFVFSRLNRTQVDQTFCGTNEGFNEIWWFYCSSASTQVDSYVVFNYVENTWVYGTLSRTAWLDSPLKDAPLAASDSGYVYLHETGHDDDRTQPITAFIESSDFDIMEGNHFCFVKRIIPDLTFDGSSAANPGVTVTLTPRNAPGANYRASDTAPVVKSVAVPVEQFTERCDVRLRGRQMKVRIESTGLGVHWKLGVPRVEVQPDGQK